MVLESLLSEQIVQTSEVDTNDKTILVPPSELTFAFNNISESLTLCKKIAFEVTLNTQYAKPIRHIYSNYTIDLKLVLTLRCTVE